MRFRAGALLKIWTPYKPQGHRGIPMKLSLCGPLVGSVCTCMWTTEKRCEKTHVVQTHLSWHASCYEPLNFEPYIKIPKTPQLQKLQLVRMTRTCSGTTRLVYVLALNPKHVSRRACICVSYYKALKAATPKAECGAPPPKS